jgi:hypothetical protein
MGYDLIAVGRNQDRLRQLDLLVNNARVRNSPLVTRQPDESRWSAERTAALSQAPATGALKDWLPVLSSARARRRREPPTGGV